MTTLIIILVVATAGLLFFVIKQTKEIKKHKAEISQRTDELENYKSKYKDIINIDEAATTRKNEIETLQKSIENLKADFDNQKEVLNQDYIGKRSIYENLLNEISIVEENLEDISYGLYKPHYDYTTSEQYKQKLEEIWNKEKELIKQERATSFSRDWTVNGSKAEGLKMVKHQSKLMLRAFNGECDGAISKVNWNNIGTMEARISKAFSAINNLGSTQSISITKDYSDLKLEELKLEFELQQKIHEEKEEQKKEDKERKR